MLRPGVRNSHIHLQHHVGDAYGHAAKPLLKMEVKILESLAALRATDIKGPGKTSATRQQVA